MNRRFVLLTQLVCLLAFPITASSQWQPDGNPIVVDPDSEQYVPTMCYDGTGTIIARVDGYDTQIKAQHFDALAQRRLRPPRPSGAGRPRREWRSAPPSGVYSYRVHAGGAAVTQKFVIAR